jgi:hypothetical protein
MAGNYQELALFVQYLEQYKEVERKEQYDFVDQILLMNITGNAAIERAAKDSLYILGEIDKIIDASEEMSVYDLSAALGPLFRQLAQCHILLTMLASNNIGGFPGDFLL